MYNTCRYTIYFNFSFPRKKQKSKVEGVKYIAQFKRAETTKGQKTFFTPWKITERMY